MSTGTIAVTAEYLGGSALDLDAVDEALTAHGVPERPEDIATAAEVISSPSEWPTASTTCTYAAQMVAGLAADSPTARHPWLLSAMTRLACALRLGCITQEDHDEAARALAARFRVLLSTAGSSRAESPREVAEAQAWGIQRATTKTAEECRAELGSHTHPGEPSETLGEPLGATEGDGDESAAARARRMFPSLDWHKLWADDAEDEWLHEPLLPARRQIVIYSPPKVGKSLFMLEFAVALTRAEEFLGYQIEARHRVLYIDFENDPRGDVRGRLQAMGYGPDDLGHLDYLSFPTMAGLDTERGSLELLEAVKAYGSEVVVIDTVSRAVDGEENSNDTWLGLYRHTGLKLKQAGVAVARLDHTGKDESKGQRGGSAKSGDVDAVWRLSKITDERLRLECTDSRMQIATKSLHLIRQQTPRLRHVAEVLGAATTSEAKIAHIIALADSNGLPADASRNDLKIFAKERGIKARTEIFAEVARQRKAVPDLGDSLLETDLSRGSGTAWDTNTEEPLDSGEKSCPQAVGTVGDNPSSPYLSPGQQYLTAPVGTAGQSDGLRAIDGRVIDTSTGEDLGPSCADPGCRTPARDGRQMCALHLPRESSHKGLS